MHDLRDRLKQEMAKRKWNAYDLAEKSGVPQSTLHRFLTGFHKDLRSGSVEKIARAFGISEASLRGLEQIEDPPRTTTADDFRAQMRNLMLLFEDFVENNSLTIHDL